MASLNFVFAGASALACFSCLYRSACGPKATKKTWKLIAAGIFLVTIGEFGLGGVGLVDQAPAITKWDFLLFVSGIPFAVAISCESEEVGLTSFPWVDGTIVALTVAVGFLLLLTGTIGWVSLPPHLPAEKPEEFFSSWQRFSGYLRSS